MPSIYSLDKTNRAALLEAVALLSQSYWGPTADSISDISRGIYLKPFEALKSLVDYKPPAILEELKTVGSDFADEDELFQCLEQAYVRLFINSREGVTAPLYASCYAPGNEPGEDSALMGPPALMMKERFESKGLSLGDHIHEPPDHLAIELEYLYFLLEKGWRDDDVSLLDEAVSFAGETMLPWVFKFQERIKRIAPVEAECRYYHIITAVLYAILRFVGASNKK